MAVRIFRTPFRCSNKSCSCKFNVQAAVWYFVKQFTRQKSDSRIRSTRIRKQKGGISNRVLAPMEKGKKKAHFILLIQYFTRFNYSPRRVRLKKCRYELDRIRTILYIPVHLSCILIPCTAVHCDVLMQFRSLSPPRLNRLRIHSFLIHTTKILNCFKLKS